jgi:CheY-like chemotaxis protein
MGIPPPSLGRVVVRNDDPETLQLIRDFLEPLGYLVECMPGKADALSASDEDQLTRTAKPGHSG